MSENVHLKQATTTKKNDALLKTFGTAEKVLIQKKGTERNNYCFVANKCSCPKA